jgi:hypothetical protein
MPLVWCSQCEGRHIVSRRGSVFSKSIHELLYSCGVFFLTLGFSLEEQERRFCDLIMVFLLNVWLSYKFNWRYPA